MLGLPPKRHFLHAAWLVFTHPVTGERVDLRSALPEELRSFYMYLHQTMGPFAQGPVALIARHDDECVFSADAMGLRPLWKLETESDYVFSS